MGKPTGFKEFPRKTVPYRDPLARLEDFNEIYTEPPEETPTPEPTPTPSPTPTPTPTPPFVPQPIYGPWEYRMTCDGADGFSDSDSDIDQLVDRAKSRLGDLEPRLIS